MRTSRLFWRLYVASLLVAAAAMLSIAVVVQWQMDALVGQARTQRLRGMTDVLRADLLRQFNQAADPADPAVMASLQQLADQLTAEGGRALSVIHPDGDVLVHAGTPRPTLLSPRALPEIQQALDRRSSVSVVRREFATGQPWHYVTVPVETTAGKLLLVRAGQPLAGSGSSGTYRAVFATTMLATFTVAAVIMFFWMRRILRPLERLTRKAQSLATDDARGAAESRGTDEIGQLGAAFSAMQAKSAGDLVALQGKSELLVSLLGNMVEGVIAVAADETVLLANAASGRMLGFAPQNAAGRPLLLVTRSRPLHETVLQAIRTRRAVLREFEAAGTPRRLLSIRAAPLAADENSGVMIVMHDATELRRLENLRRDFVANVSHELKTPLASVKAYAETLRMGAINDADNRMMFVQRIEEQAERLHELIVDLLQLARVESGKESFELASLSLSEAAQQCCRRFANAAQLKQVELAVEPSPELNVLADEEGLQTILSNLVDNAVKYTPAGGRVTVSWHRAEAAAVLAVQDTGIGIAPRDQSRVFERFFRVDKARSRELGGTGLGLSIVKHLAQALGGDVSLESQLEVGSTFRVQLPLAESLNAGTTAGTADSQDLHRNFIFLV